MNMKKYRIFAMTGFVREFTGTKAKFYDYVFAMGEAMNARDKLTTRTLARDLMRDESSLLCRMMVSPEQTTLSLVNLVDRCELTAMFKYSDALRVAADTLKEWARAVVDATVVPDDVPGVVIDVEYAKSCDSREQGGVRIDDTYISNEIKTALQIAGARVLCGHFYGGARLKALRHGHFQSWSAPRCEWWDDRRADKAILLAKDTLIVSP